MTTTMIQNQEQWNEVRRHPIALTALIELCEALVYERYEEVRDMIEIAKDFGASDWEIRELLYAGSNEGRADFLGT